MMRLLKQEEPNELLSVDHIVGLYNNYNGITARGNLQPLYETWVFVTRQEMTGKNATNGQTRVKSM
jgi:hypothetical protein